MRCDPLVIVCGGIQGQVTLVAHPPERRRGRGASSAVKLVDAEVKLKCARGPEKFVRPLGVAHAPPSLVPRRVGTTVFPPNGPPTRDRYSPWNRSHSSRIQHANFKSTPLLVHPTWSIRPTTREGIQVACLIVSFKHRAIFDTPVITGTCRCYPKWTFHIRTRRR